MLIKGPDMAMVDPRMPRKVKDDEGKEYWKGEYMAQDFNGHAWTQPYGSVCKQESFYYQWQPLQALRTKRVGLAWAMLVNGHMAAPPSLWRCQ